MECPAFRQQQLLVLNLSEESLQEKRGYHVRESILMRPHAEQEDMYAAAPGEVFGDVLCKVLEVALKQGPYRARDLCRTHTTAAGSS